MMVSCPNPSGFVVYVISEGAQCNVDIDGLGKMIVEISHGDLSYVPPKQLTLTEKKKEKKQVKRNIKLLSQTFIERKNLEMHGGFICPME